MVRRARKGIARRNRGRRIKSSINGCMLRPRRTPSEYVRAPRNQLTLTFRKTGTTKEPVTISFKISDIATNAIAQLGITKTDMNLQLVSIAAWEMEGNPILALVPDLIEKGAEPLQILEDQAGRNQWATVGYRWPKAHQNVVFSSKGDADRIGCSIVVTAGSTDVEKNYNIFLKMRVLWRGASTSSPTLRLLEDALRDVTVESPSTNVSMMF